MRMKAILPMTCLGAVLLSSCGVLERLTTPGEYNPAYLQEDSPLDPPGAAAARAAARAKLVKEGAYADGETLEVQQGKAYLFNRNPDNDPDAKGRMVDTQSARIISCEGLYYFVEVDDGSKGFLRESDFVNPVKLVSTLPAEAVGVEGWVDGAAEPAAPVQLDADQKLMTNESGRTVVVVSKRSSRSNEFEARRRALQQQGNTPEPASVPLPEPASTALPEPAASSH